MPYSSQAGKEWIGAKLHCISGIQRILDVGAGAGTYSSIFRETYRDAEWIGIEIWAPYIERFNLRHKYDQLFIGDIRYLRHEMFGRIDVCFLGDILEHMSRSDSSEIIEQLSYLCRYIFVSVPLGLTHQGPFDGNPFEKHIETYCLCDFPDVFPHVADSAVFRDATWTIGVALLERHPS